MRNLARSYTHGEQPPQHASWALSRPHKGGGSGATRPALQPAWHSCTSITAATSDSKSGRAPRAPLLRQGCAGAARRHARPLMPAAQAPAPMSRRALQTARSLQPQTPCRRLAHHRWGGIRARGATSECPRAAAGGPEQAHGLLARRRRRRAGQARGAEAGRARRARAHHLAGGICFALTKMMPANRPTRIEARFSAFQGTLKATRPITATGILFRLPTRE
jgi:hypothetical protein